MIQDWQVPLSERPDWHQTEEGHWRHISYGKNKKQPKIARNAPCPCGSGKKYKRCCIK